MLQPKKLVTILRALLQGACTELVEKFLEDTVGVARATIAEANKFPALSRHVHEAGRDRLQLRFLMSGEVNDCLQASAQSKGAF